MVVSEFSKGLADVVKKMHAFAEGLVEANRGMMAFSPRLAGAYAQMSVHDFHRRFEFARDTENTGVGLVRAVDRMRESLKEFDKFQQNLQNAAGSFSAGFVGAAGDKFAPYGRKINEWFGHKDEEWASGLGKSAWDAASWIVDPSGFWGMAERKIKQWLGIADEKPKAGADLPHADRFANFMAQQGAKGGLGAPLAGRRPGQPGVKPFRNKFGQ